MMGATDYTVASALQLLGAKPPVRREVEEVWFARCAAAATKDLQERKSRSGRSHAMSQVVKGKRVRFGDDDDAAGDNERMDTDAAEHLVDGFLHSIDAESGSGVVGGVSNASCNKHNEGENQGEGDDPGLAAVKSVVRTPIVTQPGDEAVNACKQKQSVSAARTFTTNKPNIAPIDSISRWELPEIHKHRSTTDALTKAAFLPTSKAVPTLDTFVDCEHLVGDTPSDASDASSVSSAHTKRPADIYFSPIDVRASRVEFGSPMSSPSFLTTPSKTPRHGLDDAHQLSAWQTIDTKRKDSTSTSISIAAADKLTISVQQLDQLVIAIANAPLMQTRTRSAQWLDDDDESLISLRTALAETMPSSSPSSPSLTTGSTANSLTSSPVRVTHPHIEPDQAPPSVNQYIPSSPFAILLPSHAHADRFDTPPTTGIVLTDPKVHGAPIRFLSHDYRRGANVLQIGACTFLNVPYGTTTDCLLRIEPPACAATTTTTNSPCSAKRCRVTVQILNQVLERKTGKRIYLLVAEVDVTDSVTRAALAELAAHARIPLDFLAIAPPITPSLSPPSSSSSPAAKPSAEQVDWTSLALAEAGATRSHELRHSMDLVDAAALSFASLRPETCTMQTLTLLSTLREIKTRHQDFLVVRASSARFEETGMPRSLSVGWISQHLSYRLGLDTASTYEKARWRRFREDLVAVVARRFGGGGREFVVEVPWLDNRTVVKVRCVPLCERVGGMTEAMVAFVQQSVGSRDVM